MDERRRVSDRRVAAVTSQIVAPNMAAGGRRIVRVFIVIVLGVVLFLALLGWGPIPIVGAAHFQGAGRAARIRAQPR